MDVTEETGKKDVSKEVVEVEEGEIVDEMMNFKERAHKVWTLDLSKPPRGRVVRNPLEFACDKALGKPISGMWLEFGVFSGKTINLMARHAPKGRQVLGFDTFEGLPEDWRDKFKAGHFHCKGVLPRVDSNVKLIKGLFQDTLEPTLAEYAGKDNEHIAVAHLDADLYSATIYVLRTLKPRIVPGTLLVFDELINYNGYEDHEWKAILEAVDEFGWEIEWVAQSGPLQIPVVAEIAENQQVACRVTKI